MNIDLWRSVDRFFRDDDFKGAESYLEALLRANRSDHFVSLADKSFTNSPQTILDHLEEFIEECSTEFQVQAVYCEMNGFDINYDCWYFDSFAYKDYEDDLGDLEWLCDWSSPAWPPMTLTGLEGIQEDFGWYVENRIYEQNTHEIVKELAVLLVMVRFVRLIGSAIGLDDPRLIRPVFAAKPIPLLATAHDFDIVGRFNC